MDGAVTGGIPNGKKSSECMCRPKVTGISDGRKLNKIVSEDIQT